MITNKLKEFYTAIFQEVPSENQGEWVFNELEVWIPNKQSEIISTFIDEFQEWEEAGFPNLDEYLTPINGKVRTKQQK